MARLPAYDRELLARSELIRGHYFYHLRHYFGSDVACLSMLRDPVQRSVSAINHIIRSARQHRNMTPEELIGDSLLMQSHVYNLQVRVLGAKFDADDPSAWPHDIHAAMEVGEAELGRAKQALVEMPFFGIRERMEDSVDLFAAGILDWVGRRAFGGRAPGLQRDRGTRAAVGGIGGISRVLQCTRPATLRLRNHVV